MHNYEDYIDFASKRKVSSKMRALALRWSRVAEAGVDFLFNAFFREDGSEQGFIDYLHQIDGPDALAVATFRPNFYDNKRELISPSLQCDVGRVFLNLNVSLGREKTGSWLRDYFLPRYDFQRRELPSDVIADLVFQVTDAAARCGATYTQEALGVFIKTLLNVKEIEKDILGQLLEEDVFHNTPEGVITLKNEDDINNAYVEETKRFVEKQQRRVVWQAISERCSPHVKSIVQRALKQALFKKVKPVYRALPRTRAPRSARRASFSMAAASPGGGDSSGDPDSGDPPEPYLSHPFVAPPSNSNPNRRPSHPWLGLGCCRMKRGRSA